EPLARIGCVLLEPSSCGAQAEGVAPGIHVAPHARAAHAGQLIGEKDLQIANGVLLREIAASIAIERESPPRVHADRMTRLVENRMNRRVRAPMHPIADQTCLAVA